MTDGDAAKGPGPGAHSINSRSMGKQVLSGTDSLPSYSFGTGPARVYTKQQHRVGPGAYKMPSSVGQQVSSQNETSGRTKFGNALQRPRAENINPTGPGEYKIGSTIGRQELSTRSSEPKWKFGTSQRPKPYAASATMRAVLQPAGSSMGRQARARSRTAPSCSLSGRETFGAVIANPIGPGPAAYDSPSSIGTQLRSELETCPMVGFGTSTRDGGRKPGGGHAVPGPGAYRLATLLGPSMYDSTKPSSPAPAMAGREKFGTLIDNKDAAATPGPGSYAVRGRNTRFRDQPSHSLGPKWTTETNKGSTPAPGASLCVTGLSLPLSVPFCFSRQTIGN